MVKRNEKIEIVKQLTKIMDEHNLSEIKIGDIYLKKENPKAIAERELKKDQQKHNEEIPEGLKIVAEKIIPDLIYGRNKNSPVR